MKTVVFVCILSLSMCFSATTPEKTPQNEGAATVVDHTKHQDETSTPNHSLNDTVSSTASPNATSETNTTHKVEKPKDNGNNTENGTKEVVVNEKTSTSTERQTIKPVTQPENENNSTTNKAKDNAIVTAGNDKKKGDEAKTTVHPSSQSASVVTPTVTPAVTEKPAVLARGFDGASFVGGIILTLGLLAIGFMGFKYYKNQTERNYHTL